MMVLADACKSETMKLAYLKLAAHWQELILDIQHIPARSMLEQKSGSALGGSFSAREGRRVR